MQKTPRIELKHQFGKCAFCWFALRNCITMHGTENINYRLRISKLTLINSKTNGTISFIHSYIYIYTHTIVCMYLC